MQIQGNLEKPAEKRLFSTLRSFVIKNDIAIFVAAAFGIAALSASLVAGSFAPVLFSPLTMIPNWASWFDIYVTFPVVGILCVIPFRGFSLVGKMTVVSLVAVVPLFLIFASYYIGYDAGILAVALPLTVIVPTLALMLILATPLINSFFLSYGISSKAHFEFKSKRTNVYFLAIGLVSLSLGILQVLLRLQTGGSNIPLLGWTSDIGVGVEAAARDLIHGVNPYVTGVPPWGGPAGLIWGPVSMIMIAPFSVLLSSGWAAHISAIFYGVVTAIGVGKCVKILSPKLALPAAMLFLALPTTSWVIESGTTLHIIGTLFIVWSLYMFLTRRHLWAGALCTLGLFAMLIPGALIVPYLLYSKKRDQRLSLCIGSLVPVALAVVGIFALFKSSALSLFSGALTGSLQTGYTLNIILTPTADTILRFIPTMVLVFWFIYRSLKIENDRGLLITVSIFLLLLPFAIGFYLPFFFIWGSAIAVMALFSHMSMGNEVKYLSKGDDIQ